MSETLIPAYYNTKINNHDWAIYMGGERYFPAYPIHVEEPYNPVNEYLTFEALEDGEIGWWTHPNSDVEVHVFWSKNKENWVEFTQNDSTANYITVSSGENLYCRGINLDGVSGQYALDNDACNGFVQNSGKWNIKGNAMSLIDYNNMATMAEMVGNFYYLFSGDGGFKHGNTIDIVNANDFVLPATTLVDYCYSNMFSYCTSLTTAPELPATTLVDYCYYGMFDKCTSLNYIKCLAVNGINLNNSTTNWVSGVASSGTFVKNSNATSWPTGSNGIPTNWTIEDAQ